jgi:Ni2+-binding GTPase involved in maturation of urease and hydrogenase
VRILVFGGPPASGKSCAVRWFLSAARDLGRAGVAKIDCHAAPDVEGFRRRGWPARAWLAGRVCPDHFLVERLPEVRGWAEGEGLDTLVVETAGLCGRCAPYLGEALAVAVVDATAGIRAPRKLGPLLTDADLCVVTRPDLVAPAEREVFVAGIRGRNPGATIRVLNGLTGEGAADVASAVASLEARGAAGTATPGPRTPLPQLLCSYCLGRMEAGIEVL